MDGTISIDEKYGRRHPNITHEYADNMADLEPHHVSMENFETPNVYPKKHVDNLTVGLTDLKERVKSSRREYDETLLSMHKVKRELNKYLRTLERLDESLMKVRNDHQTDEAKLKFCEKEYRDHHLRFGKQKDLEMDLRRQVENESRKLQRLSRLTDTVISDTKIIKTTSEKSCRQIRNLGIGERKQDLYAEYLRDTLQVAEDEISERERQTQACRKQLESIKETTNNARDEIRLVCMEKKYLMNQWNVCLSGIKRRDEAVDDLQPRMRSGELSNSLVKAEIKRCQSELKKETDKNDDLVRSSLTKELEISRLEEQIRNEKEEREKNSNHRACNKSLDLGSEIKDVCESKAEIKDRNNLIEKLQKEMEYYDGKLNSFVRTSGSERRPLELEINSARESINDEERTTVRLQDHWLNQQHKLMRSIKERDELADDVIELGFARNILNEKNRRLKADLERERFVVANVRRTIRKSLNYVDESNSLVHSGNVGEECLKVEKTFAKNRYVQDLKSAEIEYLRMQSEIDEADAKKRILEEDLKKYISEDLFWENKIRASKEARLTVTCDENRIEMDSLRNTRNHLKIRFAKLSRSRRKKMVETESAASRLDSTKTKFRQKSMTDSWMKSKKIAFDREIEELRKCVNRAKKKNFEYDDDINRSKEIENERVDDVRVQEVKRDRLRKHLDEINLSEEVLRHRMQINLHLLVCKQQKQKSLEAIKRGEYRKITRSDPEDDLTNQKFRIKSLIEALRELSGKHRRYDIYIAAYIDALNNRIKIL